MATNLVRKHQFGQNIAHFEKSHRNQQHDHLVLTDSGELIEFCDPRIQQIKETVESLFDVRIMHHSLYFYGVKNNNDVSKKETKEESKKNNSI